MNGIIVFIHYNRIRNMSPLEIVDRIQQVFTMGGRVCIPAKAFIRRCMQRGEKAPRIHTRIHFPNEGFSLPLHWTGRKLSEPAT